MDGGFRRFIGDGDLDHGNKGDPTNRDEQHGGHTRGTVAQGWVWRVDLLLAQVVEKQVAGGDPQLISPST